MSFCSSAKKLARITTGVLPQRPDSRFISNKHDKPFSASPPSPSQSPAATPKPAKSRKPQDYDTRVTSLVSGNSSSRHLAGGGGGVAGLGYHWRDSILDQVSDSIRRSVRLQKKLMNQAGVDNPDNCSKVEMEFRLGQITSRQANSTAYEASIGKGETNDPDAAPQTQHGQKRAGELLRLPITSPAELDRRQASFSSGFVIRGRCDGFFTIPVRLEGRPADEYIEIPQKFHTLGTWARELLVAASRANALIEEPTEDSGAATGDKDTLEVDSTAFRQLILSLHRTQSTLLAEECRETRQLSARSAESPTTTERPQGFDHELGKLFDYANVDITGSDQLIMPPLTWKRIGTTDHSVPPPQVVADSPSNSGSSESDPMNTVYHHQTIFSAGGGPYSAPEFELHATTNDGVRAEFYNGVAVSALRGSSKTFYDFADHEKSGKIKMARKAMSYNQRLSFLTGINITNQLNDLIGRITKFFKSYTVPTSLERRRDGTITDLVHPSRSLDDDGSNNNKELGRHSLYFNEHRTMCKTQVAANDFRVPQWCADFRVSVSIERGGGGTAAAGHTVEGQPRVPPLDELLPQESQPNERAKSTFSSVRLRRRTRYRFLRCHSSEYRARLTRMCWYERDLLHSLEKERNNNKAKQAEPTTKKKSKKHTSQQRVEKGITAHITEEAPSPPLARQISSCPSDAVTAGASSTIDLYEDPFADKFLHLIITDVYTMPVYEGRRHSPIVSDILKFATRGGIFVGPRYTHPRRREVELEIDVQALTRVVMEREQHYASSSQEEKKLELDCDELYSAVASRALDALGSIAIVPP